SCASSVQYPWDSWERTIAELDLETSLVSRRCTSSNSFAMPRETDTREHSHRDIIGVNKCPDNLCVARPVGKSEIENTPAAKRAMQK
ncbi:MAG: hypothetical protein ACKPKO_43835, partial [Candidatus Fonsibacter sp.]